MRLRRWTYPFPWSEMEKLQKLMIRVLDLSLAIYFELKIILHIQRVDYYEATLHLRTTGCRQPYRKNTCCWIISSSRWIDCLSHTTVVPRDAGFKKSQKLYIDHPSFDPLENIAETVPLWLRFSPLNCNHVLTGLASLSYLLSIDRTSCAPQFIFTQGSQVLYKRSRL